MEDSLFNRGIEEMEESNGRTICSIPREQMEGIEQRIFHFFYPTASESSPYMEMPTVSQTSRPCALIPTNVVVWVYIL